MAKGTFRVVEKICPFLNAPCKEKRCMMWDEKYLVCQLAYPAKRRVKGERIQPLYLNHINMETK